MPSSPRSVAARARRKEAPTAAPPTPFLRGPAADRIWIVFCPVLALAVMAAAWRFSGLSDLTVYSILFALIVTGHHMPGWIRAFGEPAVYQRHKARLWVSLAAIPAMVIVPTWLGLGAVGLTVAAAFDLWHVAMQQHGFGRIYAAKAGESDARTARLDLASVLVWYATVVFWSDSWMEAIARAFRKAGIPVFSLLTPEAWAAIRWAFLAASAALAVAYVVNAWKLRRTGVSTPTKHWLHLAAFSVLVLTYRDASWYRAQSVQNLFHALQYFFIVWIFGYLSLRREPERPAALYRALFRGRAGLAGFIGLVALYGTGAYLLSSSGYRLTGVDAERTAQVIGSIGLASLLLHFYVDSFIWKVRSRQVRTALAITGVPSSAPETPPRLAVARGVLHAIGYFGVPIAAVALLGARGHASSPAVQAAAVHHEASLFPGSAEGRYLNARAFLATGDVRAARREAEAALSLSPSFEGPAALLAAMDAQEGDREAEVEHARSAVGASPRDAGLRYSLGNALARLRRLDEAEAEYRETLRLRPDVAGAEENLGVIYKWRGRFDQALPHFRRAYALDPSLSAAARDLAGALATLGETSEALAVLGVYRLSHPEDRAAADLERGIREDASARPGSPSKAFR